jgi:hypothetical protein
MCNKKIILIILALLLIGTSAFALRASRPLVLTFPLTVDQISQLNRYLEDIWMVQQGRFELDVVTTTKTNAKNGEIWILKSGSNYTLQVKAGGSVLGCALSP